MDKIVLKRHFKKIVLLTMILGLLYAGVNSVFGVQGATSISVGPSSRANYSNTSSATTGVQAGNVTELNLTGTSITDHWAGFYGDISGNMTLGDSSGHSFYDWTGINSAAGEVYASTSNAVAWSGIGCIDIAEIANLETSLGITATDADRVNQTYTTSAHPDFTVGGVSISGCNSTNANTDAGPSATAFYQILLSDTGGDAVYTTLINESTTGFDAVAHDFELLVGESDSLGTTPLYFYLELG
jgi:hypothetical protein